jgi:hypothetical protein
VEAHENPASSLEILIAFLVVSIASVTISNPRRRLLTLTPNAFPAVRFTAKRDAGDDTPIEYIQVRTINRSS